jgi:hypothetical protein
MGKPVDMTTVHLIAATAYRDPRVVARVLRGDPRPTPQSRAAVADAIRRLGLSLVVPSPQEPTAV